MSISNNPYILSLYFSQSISKTKSHHSLDTTFREKWTKKTSRLKPFEICCSPDHFSPLRQYQRMPPYKSSLTAITSMHECPVIKMKFSAFQEKKKPTKMKMPDVGKQQRLTKADGLSYSEIDRDNHYIKRYVEEDIALIKNIFWTEKQRIFNEKNKKELKLAKKKSKSSSLSLIKMLLSSEAIIFEHFEQLICNRVS